MAEYIALPHANNAFPMAPINHPYHTRMCGLAVRTLPFITAGKSKWLSLSLRVIYKACIAESCFQNPIKAHYEQVLEN